MRILLLRRLTGLPKKKNHIVLNRHELNSLLKGSNNYGF